MSCNTLEQIREQIVEEVMKSAKIRVREVEEFYTKFRNAHVQGSWANEGMCNFEIKDLVLKELDHKAIYDNYEKGIALYSQVVLPTDSESGKTEWLTIPQNWVAEIAVKYEEERQDE